MGICSGCQTGKFLPTAEAAPKVINMSAPLPIKQQLFVQHYLKNGFENAKQAAIDSGYSPQSAEVTASRMLRHPKVAALIETARQARVETVKVSADDVLREIWAMATADMSDAFNPDGTLKAVHDMPKMLRDRLAGFEVESVHVPLKHKNGKPKVDKQGMQMYEVRGQLTKVKFTQREKLLELAGKHVGVKAFREVQDLNLKGSVTVEVVDFTNPQPPQEQTTP